MHSAAAAVAVDAGPARAAAHCTVPITVVVNLVAILLPLWCERWRGASVSCGKHELNGQDFPPVAVCVRVCVSPLACVHTGSCSELEQEGVQAWECDGNTISNLVALDAGVPVAVGPGRGMSYDFDFVFDASSTTGDVYSKLGAPIINGALEGYNG